MSDVECDAYGNEREDGFLGFRLNRLEKCWTKNDLLDYMNCDKNNGQIITTAFILKKTPKNIELIKEWYESMCMKSYKLLNDDDSNTINDSCFIEHRHDQSILSCLIKTKRNDAIILDDETYEVFDGKFDSNLAKKYPIWAQRLKY